MTHILHVTEDHTFENTGITSALDAIIRQVNGQVQQTVAAIGPGAVAAPANVPVHIFDTHGLYTIWRFAPGKRAELDRLVKQADVVHLHGIWMWAQWAAAHTALKEAIPVIITVHGMLQPWIWARQIWLQQLKKKLYWKGLAYPVFKQADLIHAHTQAEAQACRQYLPGARVEILPHGLNLVQVDQGLAEANTQVDLDERYFMTMGRLHPVKGIHLLLRAFASLDCPGYKLKIVGPTQQREKKYAESLHQLVVELNIQDRVEFTGPLQGVDKWRVYRQAWATCQPSFSEAIGIVNLEAAAAGTPVIASTQSGLVEEWQSQGGLQIEPQVEMIAAALKQAAGWTPAERNQRGQGLRKLVERTYSWSVTAPQWLELYQNLAHK